MLLLSTLTSFHTPTIAISLFQLWSQNFLWRAPQPPNQTHVPMLSDSAPPNVAVLEVRSWFMVVGLVVDYRGAWFHLVWGVWEWQIAFRSTAVELTCSHVCWGEPWSACYEFPASRTSDNVCWKTYLHTCADDYRAAPVCPKWVISKSEHRLNTNYQYVWKLKNLFCQFMGKYCALLNG